MEKTSIWKNVTVKEEDSSLYEKVDQFFEVLHGSRELEYREGQHTMALDIVDTIRDRQILLIEAQVGIGKSYAYLIPLLTAIQNKDSFHGFIIATSTIALQEQLLNDVNRVAGMLNMGPIDVVLAKGKNNFMCLSRLFEFLKESGSERYRDILNKIVDEGGSDRGDFEQLPESVWRKINVRNCRVQTCPYYGNCKFVVQREDYSKDKKIIITNQDLLAQHLKQGSDSSIFSETDIIVIDEAHNFEDKLRNAYVEALDKRRIEGAIYHLYQSVSYNDEFYPKSEFFENLNDFFTKIRFSAKYIMRKNQADIEDFSDYGRIQFVCNDAMKRVILKLNQSIADAIDEVKVRNQKNDVDTLNPRPLEILEGFSKILRDLLMKKDANNIYWVNFLDHDGKYLQLMYSPRHLDKIASNIFSNTKAGIVLTSATLDANDHYNYYSDSIGLNEVVGKAVLKECPISSPYNYEENTILYCPDDIVNPNENHELYLNQITERIKDLIEITQGRSLVLFTSKKDMNYVYHQLQQDYLDYPLYMQQEGGNHQKLKEKFEENIHSCLFATGSFFEGIDIKGESLSSLIIPRLPFPIVDPVVEEKASTYQDNFQKVYLPEMLLKLKQGTGRLIRSESDKGIVSILDSRFLLYNEKYSNLLTASLPFGEATTDLENVKKIYKCEIKVGGKNMERLQKVIANCGVCSRRKAEELILEGKVTVNGKVIRELGTKVSEKDTVEVMGKVLEKKQSLYFLLNKPRGVITSVRDEKNRKTVIDLIDIDERIYPIGRLDYDTTGVLLLTNDGGFSNLMTHPSGQIEKVYVAKLNKKIEGKDLAQLKKGVLMDGYLMKADRIKLRKTNSDGTCIVELTIHEGRNHQVKKMFESVGYLVDKLKRERVGFLTTGKLKSGEYRSLTPKEVHQFYVLAKKK